MKTYNYCLENLSNGKEFYYTRFTVAHRVASMLLSKGYQVLLTNLFTNQIVHLV